MAGPTGTPPPLLPGVMQMAIHYSDGVATATNVLHFQMSETSGLAEADVTATAASIENAWATLLWRLQAQQSWHVTTYDVVYAHIEGAPNVSRRKLSDSTSGAISTAIDYANTAYLILWSTGDPRKGGKPRTYLPGVTDASNADSANLTSGTVSSINSGISAFLSSIATITHGALSNVNLVEYSRVLHGAYRANGVTWALPAGTVSPVIATQRRRVDRLR